MNLDPRIIAEQVWERCRKRKLDRLPNARYNDYNADKGMHSARVETQPGRSIVQNIRLNLANAGLGTGDRIEYDAGIGDAQPKRKSRSIPEILPPVEPEMKYAAIVWRGDGVNRNVDAGGTSKGQLFLIRNGFPPLKISNAFLFAGLPFRPFPDLGATVFNAWVTWNEQGILSLDIQLLINDIRLTYPLHYRVDGNTLTQIDRPTHWRREAVGNLVRMGGDEGNYPPDLLYQEDDRWLLPEFTIHPSTNRIFVPNPGQTAELLEYAINPPYTLEYMRSLALQHSAFQGSSPEALYQELVIPPLLGSSIELPGFNFPEARFTITRSLNALLTFGDTAGNQINSDFSALFFRDIPPPLTVWGRLISRTSFDVPGVNAEQLTAIADPTVLPSGTEISYVTLGKSVTLL